MNTITKAIGLAGALCLTGAASAQAQSKAETIKHGGEVFAKWCAPCHGGGLGDQGRPTLPGTEALAAKYKGEKPALIEERTDLPLDVLTVFVRNGVWSMPGFRKTEISDADLKALAAYIADSASKAPKRK